MVNKKGQTASFIVNFVSTIIVIAILFLFIVFSSILTEVFDMEGQKVILKEDSLGIVNGVGYMENYVKLVQSRTLLLETKSLDIAFLETSYDE